VFGQRVQAAEVREHPGVGRVSHDFGREVERGEVQVGHADGQGSGLGARQGEHGRRLVGGDHAQAAVGQVAGIFASAAGQLEHGAAGCKDLIQPRPHAAAQLTRQWRGRELGIVGRGEGVKVHWIEDFGFVIVDLGEALQISDQKSPIRNF
jgi:hypothetical protein